MGGIVANGLNIGAADAAIGRIGELKYPYDGILGLGFDPDTSGEFHATIFRLIIFWVSH